MKNQQPPSDSSSGENTSPSFERNLMDDVRSIEWEQLAGSGPFQTLTSSDSSGVRLVCKKIVVNEDQDYLLRQLEHMKSLGCEPVQGIRWYDRLILRDNPIRLIREWVDGEPLSQWINSQPSIAEVLEFGIQLTSILKPLHDLDHVHGNLKPSNIIVNGDGQLTLVDGLIDFSGLYSSENLDCEHQLNYYSPEQLGILEGKLSNSSDLYSVGVILYEALFGKCPFQSDNIGDVLQKKLTRKIPREKREDEDVPRIIFEIISRLLATSSCNRYQTASALMHDLKLILERIEQPKPESTNLESSKLESSKPLSIPLGSTDIRQTIIEPNFLGREQEVARLKKELSNAVCGNAGLITIQAISGCGKTTLLNECATLAEQAGFWVISGNGEADVGLNSFLLLENLVDQVCLRCGNDVEFRTKIQLEMTEEKTILAEAMPKLAAILNWQSNKETGPVAFGQTRTINAICKLFGLLGTNDKPCLVIFDDCQWIDESSEKLLSQWARYRAAIPFGEQNLLMAVSFRKEEVASDHPLCKLEPTSVFGIDLFQDPEIRDIAKSMAGKLPSNVLDLVCRMAGGSPFMATGVVRGMFETGALQPTESGWEIDEESFNDMQSSSDAATLLARRIDLLAEPVREFLEHGAILGKAFDVTSVRKLLDKEPAELNEAIDRNLIWIDENNVCHFVHDKIREALLTRQSEGQRKNLHLKTAVMLEQSEELPLIDLAFHYDAAGAHESALPFALQAADHARCQFSIDLAENLYQIAERSQNATPSEKFRIASGLGDVKMLGGKYDDAAKAFGAASLIAENSVDRAKISGRLGELAFKRGDTEAATVRLEEAFRGLGSVLPSNTFSLWFLFLKEVFVQVLHTIFPSIFTCRKKRLPNEIERLRLYFGSKYAMATWFSRSKIRCMWSHFSTLNFAQGFLPCGEVAQAYSDHAPAMSLVPYPRRGIEYAKCSLRIRREMQDTWGQGQSLHYYGIVLYSAGRFEECITTCREAVRLLKKTGDYWEMHMARYQIAASLFQLGRLQEAETEARNLHESGLKLGDHQASAISLDVLARTCIGQQSPEIFETELNRERIDAQGTAQLLLGKGVHQIGCGQLEQAIETFKLALKTGRTSGLRSVYVLPNYAWLATAQRCLAERTATYQNNRKGKLLRDSQKSARQLLMTSWPMKHSVPHALRELGLTTSMQGNQARAILNIRKSIKLAKRLGMKQEERLSRIALMVINPRRSNSDALRRKVATVPNANRLFQFDALAIDNPNHRRSISLADRFNRVMSSGRDIASALTEKEILDQVESSARQLLRGQKSYLLNIETVQGIPTVSSSKNRDISKYDLLVAQNAVDSGRAVSLTSLPKTADRQPDNQSVIAAPVYVRGQLHSCLLVIHRDVQGLFNATEEKLTEFVTTIAGAALENADGFSRLQRLNNDLEKRVDERTVSLQERAKELGEANGRLKRIAKDLTLAQQELTEAKNRVEMASQAKSEFLATMSHEIRTPINAVMGMTDLCMNTNVDEVQQGYLEVVMTSARSLLNLLNDILDLSKIEANRMELEVIPFQVREVVENATNLLGINAFQKDIEIVCRVRPDVPDSVLGDPNRLQQIIINLVGNAIKFTETGEIIVEVRTLTNENGKAELQFSVTDSGVGIPKEKQSLIFDSFSQADSSTTRKFGGTGLGLSICARFVEMMNGEIWVDSEVGQGSTFHFTAQFNETPTNADESSLQTSPSKIDALEKRSVWICVANQTAAITWQELVESLHPTANVRLASVKQVDKAIKQNAASCDLLIVDVDQPELANAFKLIKSNQSKMRVLGFFRNDRTEFLTGIDHSQSLRMVSRPASKLKIEKAIDSLFGLTESAIARNEPNSPAKKTAKLRPLRLLLAEDVDINAQIATAFIERLGHNVTVAENGLKVLEAIDQGDFDAILMDIEMPEMDGLEATREIRKRESVSPDNSLLPIIAMTAHAVEEIRNQCSEAGMTDYITKPLEPARLTEVLEQLQESLSSID